MFSIPFLIFFIIAVILCLLKILTRKFNFFEIRGVKFRKPYPLVGTNTWLLRKGVFAEHLQESYNSFGNEKLFGIFDFHTPVTVIKNLDLIKKFTVKDFDNFTDHYRYVKNSELLNNTLLLMTGQRWRDMRSSLSPAFTGSKMRLMYDFVNTCAQQMVDNINEGYARSEPHSQNIKGLFTKFTNDVIASCAFGIKCDSFKDPNNEFYEFGRSFLDMRKPLVIIKVLTMRFFPLLSTYFGIDFFDAKTKKFFQEAIIDTMKTREKNNIVRPDMINLLIELRKGELKSADSEASEIKGNTNKKDWTDIEMIGQCFIFFLAGFETSSSLMVFTAHELAVNMDVQNKLRSEVEEVKTKLNGKPVTYEAIQGMKYLDMVISESLRKWPPGMFTDRICVRPYRYEDEDGLKFELDEGDMIWVPIYPLHRDPKYFPNPEKFDPERFSDENKPNLNLNAYLPFGIGPRNCIGSRFALMEAKVILYYMLANFSFEVCEETAVPLKLRGGVIGMVPDKDVILNMKPLNK